jgi:uncharacterized protein
MSDAPVFHPVPTPVGPAALRVLLPTGAPRGVLALGHGAGGGTGAPDLVEAAAAALGAGLVVALVEQPWRVAGRRVAEAAPRLDAAWRAVVEQVRRDHPEGPLVVGGRSAGARVACRTADGLDAAAVLALAFPLVSPSGRSRDAELRAPAAPVLVVQGDRDAFGVPAPSGTVTVRLVAGADHAFAVRARDGRSRRDVLAEVRDVVTAWLAER